MESTIQEELELYTQAEWYEKTKKRQACRNGYYQRSLSTQFGVINEIEVPHIREVKFNPGYFLSRGFHPSGGRGGSQTIRHESFFSDGIQYY